MTALYRQHGELFIDCKEFYVKCTLQGGSISDFLKKISISCCLPCMGTIRDRPNFFFDFGSQTQGWEFAQRFFEQIIRFFVSKTAIT